jgi:hypothetical protein
MSKISPASFRTKTRTLILNGSMERSYSGIGIGYLRKAAGKAGLYPNRQRLAAFISDINDRPIK